MYDFIDRPVTRLGKGGRFTIWAMRSWVQAVNAKTCPSAAIGPAFMKSGVIEALPHFNMAMMLLNHHAIEPLRFAPLGCARIREGEALMLHMFKGLGDASPERTGETLKLMIEEIAFTSLFTALTAVAFRLAEAGLLPEAPVIQGLPAGNNER